VLTVVSIAAAEVARSCRFLIMPLGLALAATPFFIAVGNTATLVSIGLGIALIVLSVRRGPIREHYGNWQRLIR
jgi:hypothetical protein